MSTRLGHSTGIATKDIWITGILAAVVAAILNALLVVIGVNLLGLNPDGLFQPLNGPGPVIIFSIFFLLLATLVFWWIARKAASPARAVAAFRKIALGVLLLSFIPDLLLLNQPGAGIGEIILLMLTHVVAAAVIYGAFARRFA